MDNLLYIIVGIAIPVALLLCVVLGYELSRSIAVARLYAAPGRDMRFVCSLLRYYLPGGKRRILRNPCLLTDHRGAPPRADLLVFGGSGVLIITVDDRAGHFSTPPTGDWTHWQEGKSQKVPNRFNEGRQYTSVLNGILVRLGISCSVINLVVLSDDRATADDLYSENVLTCNQLIPYVKRFCKGGMVSARSQKRLREAIVSHHSRCRRKLVESAPTPVTAEEVLLTADNLFDSLMQEDADKAQQDRNDKTPQKEE